MKNTIKKSFILGTALFAISTFNLSASISETCDITNAEFDIGILHQPYHAEIGSW